MPIYIFESSMNLPCVPLFHCPTCCCWIFFWGAKGHWVTHRTEWVRNSKNDICFHGTPKKQRFIQQSKKGGPLPVIRWSNNITLCITGRCTNCIRNLLAKKSCWVAITSRHFWIFGGYISSDFSFNPCGNITKTKRYMQTGR